MKPILLLDCYLDEHGATRLFTPLPGGTRAQAVRAAREDLPGSLDSFGGLIITGSAASVLDETVDWLPPIEALVRDAHAQRIPVLGVCFGHQLVAKVLWGPSSLRLSPTPEIGWYEIEHRTCHPLFEGIPQRFTTFLSHFDEVLPQTPGLEVLAASQRCGAQAYHVPGEPIWCVQFHAEMDAEETERLVRERCAGNPALGLDAEVVLSQRVDSSELKSRILSNFLRMAQEVGEHGQP